MQRDFVKSIQGLQVKKNLPIETGIPQFHVEQAMAICDQPHLRNPNWFVLTLAYATKGCGILYLNSSDNPSHNPEGNPNAWNEHAILLPDSQIVDVKEGGRFLYAVNMDPTQGGRRAEPKTREFPIIQKMRPGDTIHLRLNSHGRVSPAVTVTLPVRSVFGSQPHFKFDQYWYPDWNARGYNEPFRLDNPTNLLLIPNDEKIPVAGPADRFEWVTDRNSLVFSGKPCATTAGNKVEIRHGNGPLGEILGYAPVGENGSFEVKLPLSKVVGERLWVQIVDPSDNTLPLGETDPIANPLEIDTPEE